MRHPLQRDKMRQILQFGSIYFTGALLRHYSNKPFLQVLNLFVILMNLSVYLKYIQFKFEYRNCEASLTEHLI